MIGLVAKEQKEKRRKGWVDCNSPDGSGGYKSCGRSDGEKRKYPSCRPTPAHVKKKVKESLGAKKAKKKGKKEMKLTKQTLKRIIKEELEAVMNEGFFSKIFGSEDDEPERSPERQKELEDRLARMKRGEKIVKPKTADQKASDMLSGTDKMQDELSGFDSMSDDEKFNYIMKNKILTPSMKSFFTKLPNNQKIQYLKKEWKNIEVYGRRSYV